MVRLLRMSNLAVKGVAASGSREGVADELGGGDLLHQAFDLKALLQAVYQS